MEHLNKPFKTEVTVYVNISENLKYLKDSSVIVREGDRVIRDHPVNKCDVIFMKIPCMSNSALVLETSTDKNGMAELTGIQVNPKQSFYKAKL